MSTTTAPTASAAAARADRVVVTAPADATGAALTRFVQRVRAASRVAEVSIDDTACATWSPGQRLVLERLQLWLDRHESRRPTARG